MYGSERDGVRGRSGGYIYAQTYARSCSSGWTPLLEVLEYAMLVINAAQAFRNKVGPLLVTRGAPGQAGNTDSFLVRPLLSL